MSTNKPSPHLTKCLKWLEKYNLRHYKDAETITEHYRFFGGNTASYQECQQLAFEIEQDPRFDKYILRGADEEFPEHESTEN